MLRAAAVFLTIGAFATQSASTMAPAQPGQSGPTFRVGVDAVTLDVTVTDSQRRYITDLAPSDFTIFEDGRPQELRLVQQVGVPLAVSLLVDTSASMQESLPLAKEAAEEFVGALRHEDVAAVIDFDSRVDLTQAFTSEQALLRAAIGRMTAGGATALHNALYIAIRELQKGSALGDGGATRRRAIVVLSDGEDTSSLMTFDEVLDTAVRSGITVYAIGLGIGANASTATDSGRVGQFNLRRLTQQTGGQAFFPKIAAELRPVYRAVLDALSSQYTLAYESNDPRRTGQYRRIAVRVSRPGAVARSRPGYYAPRR